jgi:Na+-transporting NADH:ubiquinone oxidoreductase subunit NqrC
MIDPHKTWFVYQVVVAFGTLSIAIFAGFMAMHLKTIMTLLKSIDKSLNILKVAKLLEIKEKRQLKSTKDS